VWLSHFPLPVGVLPGAAGELLLSPSLPTQIPEGGYLFKAVIKYSLVVCLEVAQCAVLSW